MLELSRTPLNGPNDIHFWTYLSGVMQVCSFHAHVSQRIYLTLVNCAHKRLQNFESSLPHCEFVESVTKSKYGFRYLLCLKKSLFQLHTEAGQILQTRWNVTPQQSSIILKIPYLPCVALMVLVRVVVLWFSV